MVGVNSVGYTPQQKLAALPHDPVFGWLTDAEIQRVEGALASAGDLPVALFCHQLLRPWAGPAPWSPMYQIHHGDEIPGRMEQHGNVRAVFQGHAHLYDVHTEPFAGQDVTFVVCPPAICYPLGWLLLTASAGELRVQYQPLPLDELRSHSNAQGQQAWRKPSDEWDDLRIPLT